MPPHTYLTLPPQDARERLLVAALEQFTRCGYSATTVRELCEAAGISRPVLYYYFKSKEGLYLELMKGAYATFESTVSDLTAYSGSARERIIHFCEGVFDTAISNLPMVRLIYSIYYGPPQGAPSYNLDQYFERMLEVVSGLVQLGIEQGEIRTGNIVDMAWAIMSCQNTALEEQLCHPQSPRIDRAGMTRMLNLLFSGIGGNQELCMDS